MGGSGIIRTPNYPVKYEGNLNCDYQIEASPNDYVSIEFLEPFELENGMLIYLCLMSDM